MSKIKPNYLFVVSILVIAFSLLISVAACSSSYTSLAPALSSPSALVATNTAANAVVIDLVAQNVAFDKSTLTVKAGAQVTININNKDSMPHNVGIYIDQSAAQVIFKGEVFTGPTTRTYSFTAPSAPGTYFFRCDVHPAKMTGQFIVQ